MKKDRFYYGALAGVAAGVVQNSINLGSYSLELTTLRMIDWVSIMIYGHPPITILDGLFALIHQLGINAFIGIIFTYTLPLIGFEHHLFKGIVFGVGMFQFSYFVTALYRVPDLIIVPTYTAISNTVVSAIYGIVLAILVKKWIYEQSS